jgi:hypothetical protein
MNNHLEDDGDIVVVLGKLVFKSTSSNIIIGSF